MDYTIYPHLEFKSKFWKAFGSSIRITDPVSGSAVGYIQMKAWKLREDVRVYADETMAQEVMAIHAREILDFGTTYDVLDSATGQPLFSLRRKGLRTAMVRDNWELLDSSGAVVGMILETSGTLALMRRQLSAMSDVLALVFAFAPETYEITYGPAGQQPALISRIVHRRNPVAVNMNVDMSVAPAQTDPRVSIAAAALLSVMDATKNS